MSVAQEWLAAAGLRLSTAGLSQNKVGFRHRGMRLRWYHDRFQWNQERNPVVFSDGSRFCSWAQDGRVCWRCGKSLKIQFYLQRDASITILWQKLECSVVHRQCFRTSSYTISPVTRDWNFSTILCQSSTGAVTTRFLRHSQVTVLP